MIAGQKTFCVVVDVGGGEVIATFSGFGSVFWQRRIFRASQVFLRV